MAKKRPRVNSIIVADEIRQETNGKWLIVGYYTDVKLDKPPAKRSLFVHAAIEDVSPGEHEVSIVVRNFARKKRLKIEGDKFTIPTTENLILYVAELEEFTFPSAGLFSFEIHVDGTKLGETYVNLSFPEVEKRHATEEGA